MLSYSQNGAHKIVGDCSLPLTGTKCVDRIITEMVTTGTMWASYCTFESKSIGLEIVYSVSCYDVVYSRVQMA